MKRTGRYLLVVCLAAVVFLSVASVALADTQTTVPGMTERVIWDTVQVAAYKVNVSHIGNLHAEVTFKPDWADFDIYIYNESCESVWEEPMGYSGMLTGKEVIDHYVSQEDFNNAPGSTDIVPEDPYTGEPEHLRGVDYYVIVVAYNETAEFQVWGYAPYTDLSTGVTTVSDQWNWYFDPFRFPGNKNTWGTLKGTPYGYSWDFTPTSEGQGQIRLQWPARKVDGVWMVTYDLANSPKPANMETYLFVGSAWDTVFEEYGWAWYKPKAQDLATWYGHKNVWAISESGDFKPGSTYHYVPVLVGVVNDAKRGPSSGPKEGIQTIGYKATMWFPQNLFMSSAPGKVAKGKTATFKGTFALDAAWKAGAKVTLQVKKSDGTWKNLKSATTGSTGKWTVSWAPKASAWFRVKAAGNDATGLKTEYGKSKWVKVV